MGFSRKQPKKSRNLIADRLSRSFRHSSAGDDYTTTGTPTIPMDYSAEDSKKHTGFMIPEELEEMGGEPISGRRFQSKTVTSKELGGSENKSFLID